MPCRSEYMEPTYQEREKERKLRKDFETLGNQATYGADVLREYLLGNLTEKDILMWVNRDFTSTYDDLCERNAKSYVKVPTETAAKVHVLIKEYQQLDGLATRMEAPTKKQLAKIEKDQITHREEDLKRLMKTFADKGDRVRLRKVLDADNTKPLEPQLGFSPDAF